MWFRQNFKYRSKIDMPTVWKAIHHTVCISYNNWMITKFHRKWQSNVKTFLSWRLAFHLTHLHSFYHATGNRICKLLFVHIVLQSFGLRKRAITNINLSQEVSRIFQHLTPTCTRLPQAQVQVQAVEFLCKAMREQAMSYSSLFTMLGLVEERVIY